MVKDVNVVLGKRKCKDPVVDGPWKKKSIFCELPYWKSLYVCHCLDVMHIKKNVCESIVGMLLDISNKTKDGENARLDLKKMKIKTNLHPEKRSNNTYLPPAKHTLFRQEKRKFCEWLASVKMPSGYSSNFKRLVSVKDLRLVGMKTYDFHIMMQQLLPLALWGVLTKDVRYSITKLCSFFNSICSKVIDPLMLDSLQSELVMTLCMLEKYFPPAFFDIMIHLTVYLVREVKLCGPVHLRWMYPFERYRKVLKGYVKNRNRPEGCIVENYIVEKSVEFYSEYLSNAELIGLPKSVLLASKGLSMGISSLVNQAEWEKASLYVLHNVKEVEPFFEVHMAELRAVNPRKGRSEKWIQDEHNWTFWEWIRKDLHMKVGISQDLLKLSRGSSSIVTRYTSYFVNGNSFYTYEREEKHSIQNSGVTLRAESMHISSTKDKNPVYSLMNYFRFIEDIWELDYCDLRIALFKCKWADNNYVKIDSDSVTVVDFRRLVYKNDPFIMASQAVLVFYTMDLDNLELSLVVPMKPRIRWDGQEDMEDCTDIPSFTKGLPLVEEIDDFNDDVSHLLRLDVEWTRVEKPK